MVTDDYSKQLWDIQTQVKYYESILNNAGDKRYDILRELYSYYKSATADLVKAGGKIGSLQMRYIAYEIEQILNSLPNECIIDIKPYDFSKERQLNSPFDIANALDTLIYEERCRLLANAKKAGYNFLEEYDLIGDCRLSALSICNMAKKMGLKAKVKIIEPGYIHNSMLYDGGCQHVVTFVFFRAKVFLLDATYMQFFPKKRCLLEKLGCPYLAPPNPGTFMTMNASRKKTAEDLLNRGWIELDITNMKNYFDGFTMFYRNGLYYETTEDFTYEPIYSFMDYFRFLNGADNQAFHEGYANLGLQRRILKDPNMSFTKR